MSNLLPIVGLESLASVPAEDNFRVKVLWFEDKGPIGISQNLKSFVQVTRAWIPEAAEELLATEREQVAQAVHSPVYRLAECPHDIYIADHFLFEAPTNDYGQPTPARLAEAAGLTASVMMALSFPAHPATVIPYTAYEERVRNQRDLIRRFCPKFINIRWDDKFGKMQSDFALLLVEALRAHREYLPVAAAAGYIHLRSEERERLNRELTSIVKSGRRLGKLRMSLETNWGSREILLGGLWPDLALSLDPLSGLECEQLLVWLDSFCVGGLDEQIAAQFARAYFWMSVSSRSEARYRLSHRLRMGVEANDRDVSGLCERIGLPEGKVFEYAELVSRLRIMERKLDVIRAGRGQDLGAREVELVVESLAVHREEAARVSSLLRLPYGWSVKHLLNAMRGFGDQIKRLAVFFLLLHEEARRWAFREALLEEMPGLKTLVQGWYKAYKRHIPELSGDKIVLRMAQAVQGLESAQRLDEDVKGGEEGGVGDIAEGLIACGIPEGEVQDFFDLLGHPITVVMMTPLTVDWVPRLLDPIPEQIDTADADVTAGRIGVALKRIGIGDIGALLAPGGGGQIRREEREALRRFAMDLGFPRSKWPAWMK